MEERIPGHVDQIVKDSMGWRVWFMGDEAHELGGPQVRMCVAGFDAPIGQPGHLVIDEKDDAVRFEASSAQQ